MKCNWNLAETYFENVLEKIISLQNKRAIGYVGREEKFKIRVKEFRLE